jgi:hypothetical protein
LTNVYSISAFPSGNLIVIALLFPSRTDWEKPGCLIEDTNYSRVLVFLRVNRMPIAEFHNPHSLGTLYSKKPGSDSEGREEEWSFLGEAHGAITLPDRTAIYFDCRLPSLEHLPDSLSAALEVLDLSNSRPSSAQLAEIAHLSNLKVLRLMEVEIDDSGLEAICNLSQLENLSLLQCHITATSFKQLAALTHLDELSLSCCSWIHSIVPALAHLPELRILRLCSTAVKAAELHKLNASHRLEFLDLYSTSIGQAKVEELKTMFPNCDIKWAKLKKVRSKPLRLPKTNPEKYRPISHGAMNEEKFWQIIDAFDWSKEGDDDAVLAPALATLAKFSEKEIRTFDDILSQKLYMLDGETYAREVGENYAFRREGEPTSPDNVFSPDFFLYARACVIANGRDYFYDVIENPANIPKGLDFEALLYLAQTAWESQTKKEYEHSCRYDYETFANEKLWPCLD